MVELAHYTAGPFITRPFVRLSETAEAWRLGNTEARAGLTDGQGEIGRVGIVLDAFMDELPAARAARHHLEQQWGLDRSADRESGGRYGRAAHMRRRRWVPNGCCEPGPPMRPRFVLRRMRGAGAGLSAFDLAVLAAIAPVSREELTDILGKRSFSILSPVERDLIGTGAGRSPAAAHPIRSLTDRFLSAFGMQSFRDLPDLEQLDDAGLAEPAGKVVPSSCLND